MTVQGYPVACSKAYTLPPPRENSAELPEEATGCALAWSQQAIGSRLVLATSICIFSSKSLPFSRLRFLISKMGTNDPQVLLSSRSPWLDFLACEWRGEGWAVCHTQFSLYFSGGYSVPALKSSAPTSETEVLEIVCIFSKVGVCPTPPVGVRR